MVLFIIFGLDVAHAMRRVETTQIQFQAPCFRTTMRASGCDQASCQRPGTNCSEVTAQRMLYSNKAFVQLRYKPKASACRSTVSLLLIFQFTLCPTHVIHSRKTWLPACFLFSLRLLRWSQQLTHPSSSRPTLMCSTLSTPSTQSRPPTGQACLITGERHSLCLPMARPVSWHTSTAAVWAYMFSTLHRRP